MHVKRLINAGHKVGVVRQIETAACVLYSPLTHTRQSEIFPPRRLKKISDNRNAPFTRSLTALYTSATFIDELSTDPLETAGTATATLLCIVEEDKVRNDGKVRIGLVGELIAL